MRRNSRMLQLNNPDCAHFRTCHLIRITFDNSIETSNPCRNCLKLAQFFVEIAWAKLRTSPQNSCRRGGLTTTLLHSTVVANGPKRSRRLVAFVSAVGGITAAPTSDRRGS